MTKILLYDSDAQCRELLKQTLTSLGCEPVVATDGYAVIPMAEQHKPDVIVLDYKMPEADGFEILKRLRGFDKFAALPIIFASSTAKFEIEMSVMDAPAIGYVDKPVDAAQLKEAIESLVGPIAGAAAAAPAAPVAAAAPVEILPPDEPSAAASPVAFNGEPDLDGVREDVIDLD